MRHLLIDEYITGLHTEDYSRPVQHPPFVCHFLLAKCRELSFDMIIVQLKDLLKICKDTVGSSRGVTIGSAKTGMSILVESFPSGSEGNEEVLLELRKTLELLASQSWVREKCSKQTTKQLLELDCLGDASLTPPQVTPSYPPSQSPSQSRSTFTLTQSLPRFLTRSFSSPILPYLYPSLCRSLILFHPGSVPAQPADPLLYQGHSRQDH